LLSVFKKKDGGGLKKERKRGAKSERALCIYIFTPSVIHFQPGAVLKCKRKERERSI